ncbi:uncharacterized protein [Choristoneura fumiferana]|uniref:uncharacterized protein n=1 Tax=Choristoneura fumiferana TaxID=7141 RepID=UPI003D15AE9A
MNTISAAVLLACAFLAVESRTRIVIVGIDQREVCRIKLSCVDCLRLAHCSWCKTKNKCFSNELASEFCKDDTNEYSDFGFSLEDNARCACLPQSNITQNCHPGGVATAEPSPPCSGRGSCVCGRCVCKTYPNSTKIVMGDYCEYDNFSCDSPRCSEGPYLLNHPMADP